MSNLDVALESFWQLARHWEHGETAKLEAGSLDIQLYLKLRHPDLLHFQHPFAPPCKRKSPSQLRRQERRCHAAKTMLKKLSLHKIKCRGYCSQKRS